MRSVQTLTDIWNNEGKKVGGGWRPGLGFAVFEEFTSNPAGGGRKDCFRGENKSETLI